MIQQETFLQVVDNSGVKVIKCFHILKSSRRLKGFIGDVIKGSVRELRYNGQKKLIHKQGDVVFALIVQVKQVIKRKTGQHFQFFKNSAILIDSKSQPTGSRISLPLLKEFRNKKYLKILSLASVIL